VYTIIYFFIGLAISMIDPINILCYVVAGSIAKNRNQALICGLIAAFLMLILVVLLAQHEMRQLNALDLTTRFTGTLLGSFAVFYIKQALKKSRDDKATVTEDTAVTNEKNEENRDKTSS